MRRREFIGLVAAGASGWAFAVGAQQPGKVYRIAIVHPAFPISLMTETGDSNYAVLFRELRKRGYTEGQNIIIARYSGEGRPEQFGELAAEVVRTKPDLIIVSSRRLVQRFHRVTTTVPIIVAGTMDPVADGIVSNLARPGGNITGFSSEAGLDAYTKHIELVKEVSPGAVRIGWLAPEETWATRYAATMREAAEHAGSKLIGPELRTPIREAEYRRVFAAMAANSVEALIVGAVADNHAHSKLIVELADTLRVPAVFPDRAYAEHGGLMAYGINRARTFMGVAEYVDRVLRGENPGDLPFQQPSTYHLSLNLKTASALGLTIPPTLLARADEVIE